ncbi:PDK repeat-containing protein [Bernardetia litoralis DSM 6794]|uniref:PDK repeat-containing protein n=1 Tax=Bernardetia litoralis (strain ATCC 23117 / DSM 6794 / NBRC 15988 / NCIMB 1366 / Fx l1 / Sio-4) TaxID=880071 RepID=I4ANX5_BERLS|nr:gliding motility-associated C-terminal domain-containing protein [Bernardetia litoralis]AFM05660.1 PDK repeat-containing protein [Bernardetia litoralis DSM 6794]
MIFINNYPKLLKNYIIVLFFLFFLFLQGFSFAQEANFTIQGTKGCAPFTVTVQDESGAAPNQVSYKFGEGNVQTENTFTFIMPGIYSVTQFVSGGSSLQKTNVIRVFSRQPVDFKIIRCVGKKIKLDIQDFYYDAYKIDFGDNTFAQTGDNGSVEHTYSTEEEYTVVVRGLFDEDTENCIATERVIKPVEGLLPAVINRLEAFADGTAQIDYTLNTSLPHVLEILTSNGFEYKATIPEDSNNYLIQNASPGDTYRMSVRDQCQSDTKNSSIFYIPNSNTTVEDNHVNINWEVNRELDANEFVKYSILRNGESIFETTDSSLVYLKDEAVACQVRYCYQVEIEYSSGLKLISPERCVLAQSNLPPPAVSDVYATFTPTNQTILNWNYPNGIEADSINSLSFIRNDNIGNTTKYNLPSSTINFEDTQVNIDSSPYCYSISYVSSCKLSSEFSGFICPILLSYEGTPTNKEGILTFNWTAFGGLETSNYVLEQTDTLNKEPFAIQNISNGAGFYTIDIENQEKQTIHVRVRADLGDTTTYSNTVRIDFRSFINLPNAFTPNGDNLNDTYGIESKFIKEFEMMIFNRWGEIVFQTNDVNGRWDGRYRNGFAPSGEYTLKIVAFDQRNKKHTLTEMIKLIR